MYGNSNDEEQTGQSYSDTGPSNRLVNTTLSISPNQNISKEDHTFYTYHNQKSPKLKVNEVSIYAIKFTKCEDNSLEVVGLVRNTVKRNIDLKKNPIVLLDADNRVIARKTFNLTQIRTIPPNAARPWKFTFSPGDFIANDVPDASTWSLAFETQKGYQLDLEGLGKEFTEKTQQTLLEVIANAPPMEQDELNFMGLSIKGNKNGDLTTIILIRNGSNNNIKLKQLPLELKDASNEIIAKGTFILKSLTVKANTSKPTTFVFPASSILKEEIDLSTWKVYARQ